MNTGAAPTAPGWIELPDAALYFDPHWLVDHDTLMAELAATVAWEQHRVRLFGREHPAPRLNAWFSDPGVHYRYSGLTLAPAPWPPALAAVRALLERDVGRRFNSVLLNYYRDGRDGMGMHSDDEPELGPEPAVATVTLGGARRFVMRHRQRRELRWECELGGGSLLVMAGRSQHCWRHAVPKTMRTVAPRISLTFRLVREASPAGVIDRGSRGK